MTILLRMDDKMNRQLTCLVTDIDTSLLLAQELVHFGFINEVSVVWFFIRHTKFAFIDLIIYWVFLLVKFVILKFLTLTFENFII